MDRRTTIKWVLAASASWPLLRGRSGSAAEAGEAGEAAPAALFALKIARAHLVYLHLEQFFNRGFHLDLIRIGRDFKAQGALGLFFRDTFFGNDWLFYDFINVNANPSESFFAAASLIKTCL